MHITLSKHFGLSSLLLTLTVLINPPASADEVTIVADRWYPYNGIPQSPNPGYIIEIARYALEKGGHQLQYQLMSWHRALEQVQQGQKNCVVGAYKSEADGFVFPDIHQGVDQVVLFRRKGDSWQYSGVDSLKQIRLGIIEGYEYADDVDLYIQQQKTSNKIKLTRGKFALEQNLAALINRELDVVIESNTVVMASIKKQGWENEIEFAGEANILSKMYIACSPARTDSAEYVKLIADGTRALRASGQLQKILDKYGLADWHHLPAVDN